MNSANININRRKYLRAIFALLIFLVFWEILARTGMINESLASSPIKIMIAGKDLFVSGEIWPHIDVSAEVFFAGFVCALFVGIFGGILLGSVKWLGDYFDPFVLILSALPMVAVLPLFIIWLGIGILSKIVIVFLMMLVPILINTIDGVKNTDARFFDMAASFGANKFYLARFVSFFNSLPYIFSGIRLSIGRGIIGLIVAEVFGYGKGLGYLISYYGATFQIAKLLSIVSILLCFVLFMDFMISKIEHRMLFWK